MFSCDLPFFATKVMNETGHLNFLPWMLREFYVLGFPSQNNTQRKIKGREKIILNMWNKPQHSFTNLPFILGSFPADTNSD